MREPKAKTSRFVYTTYALHVGHFGVWNPAILAVSYSDDQYTAAIGTVDK
eukprot:m.21273 g.21273  ORF g.21273 m.21273 type:complete len:50 (-) comp8268_c0_seq2:235-384(-)